MSNDQTRDRERRAAIERHWAASDGNDFETEHEIYRDDAVLDYPQSGERIHGRHDIQESRTVQPSRKRFLVQQILGSGDLWITELVLTYDGVPSGATFAQPKTSECTEADGGSWPGNAPGVGTS